MLSKSFIFFTILITTIFVTGCAQKKIDESQYSGFLQDYSKLKAEKDSRGVQVLRFISPTLKSQDYYKIILEPIQFFPAPKETEEVSLETLEQIKAYIDEALRREIGRVLQIVDTPGDRVARMRVALTAVGAGVEDLQPRQYIPLALVLTDAQAAAGDHPHQASLFLEAELSDSENGERLAIAIRRGEGEGFQGAEGQGSSVTLVSVKPLIDRWARAYAMFLLRIF